MALEVNPTTGSKTLWAGTGENFGGVGHLGGGLFKSTDNGMLGMRWEANIPSQQGQWQYVQALSITHDDEAHTVMLAAVDGGLAGNSGIMRSTDGGGTWSQRMSGRGGSVKFDPSSTGVPVSSMKAIATITTPVSNVDKNHAIYTTNGGTDWTPAVRVTGSPSSTPNFDASTDNPIQFLYQTSNLVYANEPTSGTSIISKSTDGGHR
jgi:hypothetical protein